MQIIGRIIKKTAQIKKKRIIRKGLSFDYQINTLKKLLYKARKTNLGKSYHFPVLTEQENPIKGYQAQVPITDYEQFYTTWLHRTIDGVKDNTWPGKITYFALSSGTTGSPSKRIPVTQEMIRSFQKTSIKQMSTLLDLNLPPKFFQKSILVVGGSTQLQQIENHIEGDLSGILKKHTKWIVSPFTRPDGKTTDIKDWNKKLEIMVQAAPKWDIGIMAGVPSWCIMLIEKIIERYELNSIHDIWPNFKVYVHGGVFMQPYVKRLERLVGEEVFLLDTYLASEGYFAYQNKIKHNAMQLLLNSGIFYEFIPFNATYFDENGNLKDAHKAFTIEEVEPGIDYALVITTNAGLWRYLIGDLVQFTDVAQREIKITGRIKQYLSLVGEHLSLDNIQEALSGVGKDVALEFEEYCVFSDTVNQRHVWTLGVNSTVDSELIKTKLDEKLKLLNDDYASVRKYNLGEPVLQCIPTSYFYEYMEKLGKLGSQNKFPRVMNTHQSTQWKQFLTEKTNP
jgi:hypothetical protein